MQKTGRLVLSLLLAVALCLPSMALTLSSVESSVELDVPEIQGNVSVETRLQVDSGTPLADGLGYLVFSQNFNTGDYVETTQNPYRYSITPTSNDSTYKFRTFLHNTGSSRVIAAPNGEGGRVLEVLKPSNSNTYNCKLGFETFPILPGNYATKYKYMATSKNMGVLQEVWTLGFNGTANAVLPQRDVDNTQAKASPNEWFTEIARGYARATEDGKIQFKTSQSEVQVDSNNYLLNFCWAIGDSNQTYFDDIEIYYYPEKTAMLNVDGELELIEAVDDVFTLPKRDGVGYWADGDTTYQPGETVDVNAFEYHTLTAAVERILADGLGYLVFSQNFDEGEYKKTSSNGTANYYNITPTYNNPTYQFRTFLHNDYATSRVIAAPNGEDGCVLEVQKPSNYNTYNCKLAFETFPILPGNYATKYKYMATSKSMGVLQEVWTLGINSTATQKPQRDVDNTQAKASPNEWFTEIARGYARTTEDGKIQFITSQSEVKVDANNYLLNFCWAIGDSNQTYFDDIEVYYYPEKTAMLSVDGKLELIEAVDGKFALPVRDGLGSWTDGSTYYQPGETVDVSIGEYKTFTAAAPVEPVEKLVDGLGRLMYSHDFDRGTWTFTNPGADFSQSSAQYSLDHAVYEDPSLAFYKFMVYGGTGELVENPSGSGRVWKIQRRSNFQTDSFGVYFSEFLPQPGNYTMNFKYMAKSKDMWALNACWRLDLVNNVSTYRESNEVSVLSADARGKVDQWFDGTSRACIRTENGKAVIGPDVNNLATPSFTAERIRCALLKTDCSTVYIDDLNLYYYPENSFMLKTEDGLELIETDGGEYTFPCPENATNFIAWRAENGSTYSAGATAAVSTLEYKTFTAVYGNPKPVNLGKYSLRNDLPNGGLGMRFSSFISSVQREISTEYGFIVSLADFYPDKDYSDLVFPDELKGATVLAEGVTGKGTTAAGKRFLYATSFDGEGGSVDIHKPYECNGIDGYRINALLVNIAGATEDTEFVVRAYIRIGGAYYYGEPMVMSQNAIKEHIIANGGEIA